MIGGKEMFKKLIVRVCPKLPQYYMFIMMFTLVFMCFTLNVYAADIWDTAKTVIIDIYNKIAAISTVLAGLMSAIAVLGAKLSNNQHKVDQAWDWLRRIWVAWAVINGIGAFIAYVQPLFNGLNKIG